MAFHISTFSDRTSSFTSPRHVSALYQLGTQKRLHNDHLLLLIPHTILKLIGDHMRKICAYLCKFNKAIKFR